MTITRTTALVATAAAAALLATSASAADIARKSRDVVAAPAPSIFDIAFGGGIQSDYNFRGISQSDRGPGVFAYFEPRLNLTPNFQLYGGIAGYSVDLATRPSAEIDLYAGIRPTFGPLAFDFGLMYYLYPSETQFVNTAVNVPVPGAQLAFQNGNTTLKNTDFLEFYGKVAYTFLNDQVVLGANVFHTDNWLNTGANGTYYSGTLKVNLPSSVPNWGWYVSGEFGAYDLGQTKVDRAVWNTSPTGSIKLPDYNYWNVGVAFTHKVFTLDLRYHDTDLNKGECNILTGDPGAVVGAGPIDPIRNATGNGSKWCGGAFIAKLSFDLTYSGLK